MSISQSFMLMHQFNIYYKEQASLVALIQNAQQSTYFEQFNKEIESYHQLALATFSSKKTEVLDKINKLIDQISNAEDFSPRLIDYIHNTYANHLVKIMQYTQAYQESGDLKTDTCQMLYDPLAELLNSKLISTTKEGMCHSINVHEYLISLTEGTTYLSEYTTLSQCKILKCMECLFESIKVAIIQNIGENYATQNTEDVIVKLSILVDQKGKKLYFWDSIIKNEQKKRQLQEKANQALAEIIKKLRGVNIMKINEIEGKLII